MRRFSQEYVNYINSPEWAVYRRRVLKHWKFRCANCGATGVILQVHHLTYERLGRERLSDCVPLCVKYGCHKEADEERQQTVGYKGKRVHKPKLVRKRRR